MSTVRIALAKVHLPELRTGKEGLNLPLAKALTRQTLESLLKSRSRFTFYALCLTSDYLCESQFSSQLGKIDRVEIELIELIEIELIELIELIEPA